MMTRMLNNSRNSRSLSFAPDGIVYAIGDIHGRIDLLERLLRRIEEDIAQSDASRNDITMVFLGDYVDRGDHSAKVIDRLVALHQTPPVPIRFLKGNHEAMMMDFLDEPEINVSWLRYGGLATLMSFGVRGVTESANAMTCLRAARELRDALGLQQRMFLDEALHLKFQSGNIFLCHAGIDPERPLTEQHESVLLWGHEHFLQHGGPPEAWVIHGHTVQAEPDFGTNRLGIDTGAYYSGRLTAARIAPGEVRFLTS